MDTERFPKISLLFGLGILSSIVLYNVAAHLLMWWADVVRWEAYSVHSVQWGIGNSVLYLLTTLVTSALVLLLWNRLFVRAFECPRIRYMHAVLIVFLHIVLTSVH